MEDSYIEYIQNIELLSSEEEIYLLKNKDNKQYFDKLVLHNLRLVINIAKNYQNCGLDLSDLIQFGVIGLINAIQNYEISFETALSTYAVPAIKRNIERGLNETSRTIKISSEQLKKLNKIKNIDIKYYENNHTYLDNIELFNYIKRNNLMDIDISLEDISYYRNFFNINSVISLNTPIQCSSDDTIDLMDTIRDTYNFEETILDEIDTTQMSLLLKDILSEMEYKVITLKFGFVDTKCYSYQDIANICNIKLKEVKNIETHALRKLRHPKNKAKLKYFM